MGNPSNHFTIKNYLFGTVKLPRNTIKSKFIYEVRGLSFDGAGSRSFESEFFINPVIFYDDNCSSIFIDNLKNNFLVLGEGPTDGIDNSIGAAETKFIINLTKENTKFLFILDCNRGKNYLHVKKTAICKFKVPDSIPFSMSYV